MNFQNCAKSLNLMISTKLILAFVTYRLDIGVINLREKVIPVIGLLWSPILQRSLWDHPFACSLGSDRNCSCGLDFPNRFEGLL